MKKFFIILFAICILSSCSSEKESVIDDAMNKTYGSDKEFVEEFSLMIYEYLQKSPDFSRDTWSVDKTDEETIIYFTKKDESIVYLMFTNDETPILNACSIRSNLEADEIASLCERYEEEGVLRDMYYTDIEDLYSPMYSTDLGHAESEILEAFKSDNGALGTFGAEYGIHARSFEISTYDYLSDTNVSIDIE